MASSVGVVHAPLPTDTMRGGMGVGVEAFLCASEIGSESSTVAATASMLGGNPTVLIEGTCVRRVEKGG